MKLVDQIRLLEHGQSGFAGFVVRVIKVDEFEAEQIVLFGLHLVGHEFEGVLVAGRRVVAQTLERDLLLGHELAGRLVHLGVVDTETAKNRECLEYRDVRVREGDSVVLVYQLGHADHLTLTVHYRHAEDATGRLGTHLRYAQI